MICFSLFRFLQFELHTVYDTAFSEISICVNPELEENVHESVEKRNLSNINISLFITAIY
jgi:hypothetical protein